MHRLARQICCWKIALALCAGLPVNVLAVTISTVPVGNPGNAAELNGTMTKMVGAVAYNYRIATTEVTNSQYAEFLNVKATTDPLNLYNSFMGSEARGGITRSGVSGSFSYAVKSNMGDKPVNFVSWYDAARFANWLHNGQGSGSTETGAYTLLGNTATPSNGLTVTRNSGAIWFLPSEDEWFKAAYYDPTLNGGAGDYWDLAFTGFGGATAATADSVGNISNPGYHVANYNLGADWNGQNGNLTTVGSAGDSSRSYYGTFDQTGNVTEWNETLFSDDWRVLHGGGYNTGFVQISKLWQDGANPSTSVYIHVGFRVATIPEPSSLVLAALGLIGSAALTYRRQSALPIAR